MGERESEEVVRIARNVAASITPGLEHRLAEVYGDDWLTVVNERRPAEGTSQRRLRSLTDHRFCLAAFGYDPATVGWVAESWRHMARELVGLANQAVHDATLSDGAVERARSIGRSFRDTFRSAGLAEERASADGEQHWRSPYLTDRDVDTLILVTAEQAREQAIIPVQFTVNAGRLPQARTVNVRLPPDLSNRQTIRVKGMGMKQEGEVPPGDLYITVLIK